MQKHMGQFVQQAEPEIVEAVITQGKGDQGRAVRTVHCGSVQIGPVEVTENEKSDTCLAHPGNRLQRSVRLGAQSGDLAQERGTVNPSGVEGRIERPIPARHSHGLCAPGRKRMGIRHGILARATAERGSSAIRTECFGQERTDQILLLVRNGFHRRQPAAPDHFPNREAVPILGGGFRQGRARPSEKYIGRDAQMSVQGADHTQGQVAAAVQHFIDAVAPAEAGRDVGGCQLGLVHSKADRVDRVRGPDRGCAAFVRLDRQGQHLQLILLVGTAVLHDHEGVEPLQSRFVVGFRPDGTDDAHGSVLLGFSNGVGIDAVIFGVGADPSDPDDPSDKLDYRN